MKGAPRDMARRHLPIEGAFNVRDLGGYPTKDGGETRWRRFLRADSLHRIAPAGMDHLLDEGLRTVVDLRTRAEAATAPSVFADLGGVDYINMPLFDDLAPAALGQAKRRPEDPLLEFYVTALDTRHDALREILAAMASAPTGTVMFNCTAGKDRTGLVAALLLGLAGVDRPQIVADYVLTAELIPELVDEFLELSRQRGGDVVAYERMLRSPAKTLEAALARIDGGHGDIPAYLSATGLDKTQIAALRDRLMAESYPTA